ncbi:MFS family permease [Arthrobacter globiformis]|nr:MFS family permease [Arthrobacter globiformis]
MTMNSALHPERASANQASSGGGARDWFALALLMFPVLLVAVDNTALTFALPAIARSLDPSGVQLLWIVDAYALVLAGLLMAMGSLGDRIGRRRLLLVGISGFAAVSAASAFAPSAEWLIAGRAAMGFFGAMLMPSTLSLIRNIFQEPGRRRLAVAIWAAGFSGGAALGPIFGGWLVEHFWWGAVLLVAVPIMLPPLVFGRFLIPESKDPSPGRVDGPSIALSMLTMVPVVYGIKELATHGPGVQSLGTLAFGLAMGLVFIRRQQALASPLLDLSLFRNRVFSTAITANVLALFSYNGFILFLAQHLQLLEGMSPSESGTAMLPALTAMVVAGLLVVPLVRKVRPGFV